MSLALLGIIAFLTIGIVVEKQLGIPFAITFRVGCAGACLFLIGKISSDYPGERWPRIAFLISLLFDIGLFFSPLAHLPASKGDIMFFAAPNAAVLLAARIVSYRVTDDHQLAVRQQMILGLIVALALCVFIFAMMLIDAYRH